MSQEPIDAPRGNILVVDDSPANLRLLAGILAERGYTVRPVTQGRLALSGARGSTPPDLILLDILMPEPDGYEVCRQLKADERTRDIPVIFTSALDQAFDVVQAFAAGGVDYIGKPFHEEEVLARIEAHLALRRAKKELEGKNAQLVRANEQLARQIAERAQAEEGLRLSHRFLEIANRHTELPALLGECVVQVRAFAGCAAVGIRLLDDEGNIPYQAYEGFSQRFYESESPLSVGVDPCMCINVVKGEVDPALPFYTEGGSFYMNGTTRFLATVSEEEKGQTRNVCNQAGYESVALVPIRLGEQILGWIHVADPRENMVPLERVQALEGASKELGTAIQRVRAEAALQRARDELEQRVQARTAELAGANANLQAEIAERRRAQEALRRSAERLQILREIDQGILAAHSPETIAQAAVAHLRRLVPFKRVGITLFDFAAGEALLLATDLDAQTRLQPGARIPLEPFEDAIAAGRQGKVSVVTGLESRGRATEILLGEGIRAFVVVPLLSQDTLIGSINFSLGASDPHAFARQWEEVARPVADQLSIAIQHARLYEQVQRHAEDLERRVAARTRELAAFFDLSTLTARGRDLSEILEPALTRIWEVARCRALCVHLLDEEGGALQLASQRNLPARARQQLEHVALGEAFLHRIRLPGDPIVTSNLSGSSPLPGPLCLEGFSSYLGVPLRAGERPLGWLSYYRVADGGFALDETALLVALSEQVGVIVENHGLRLRIEEAAVLEERGRLARELHDSVTQSLYSMVLLTDGGRRLAAAGEMDRSQAYFSELEEIALQALKEMRLLVYELRPSALEGEGLVGALQQRLDAVEGRANVEARLLVEGAIDLPAAVEAALYGIAQEALNNALKHASASSVTVRLRPIQGGQVELEITDNGFGFDPQAVDSAGGMGLASMRERADQAGARLEVISAPEKGTTVKVTVG